MSKADIKKATNEYYELLKKNGIENVLIYAVSEDHEKNLSFAKVHGLNVATAMISMLIKIVSMESETESTDLAKTIYESLAEAEKKFAELEKELQKKREQDISVNINIV